MSADRSMTKDVFHRVSARPVHASFAQTANGRPSPTGPQSSRRARVVSVFKRNLRSCSNRRPLTVSSGAIGTVRRRLACRSSNRAHIFGTSQADPFGVASADYRTFPFGDPWVILSCVWSFRVSSRSPTHSHVRALGDSACACCTGGGTQLLFAALAALSAAFLSTIAFQAA